jgi:dodecin
MPTEKRSRAGRVAKIIELVSTSPKSWDDAVRVGIEEAGRTVRGIRGVDIQDWTAKVENGRITAYKVNLKIAFSVEG